MQTAKKQNPEAEEWCIVKFSDIARNVSTRVDPKKTDLKVYVGLEHLDPDNLRITRRGTPRDVEGQKLRVKPGQIIFGKRRAYQRKVAVADFDGICSAHAMVLEAIPDAVIPEYLPFFMQSDMFMERAVAISEGSLSPTIKWKTLANQEFPLPPRKRQEKTIEVLDNIEKCIGVNTEASERALTCKNAIFHKFSSDQGKEDIALQEYLLRSPEYGANVSAEALTDKTYRYIRVTDITADGCLDLTVAAGATKQNTRKYLLEDDDFLVARTGATVGKPFLYNKLKHGEAIFAGYLLRLKFDHNKIIPQYFKHFTDTKKYWHWVNINARGAAQPNINAKQVEIIPIPNLHIDKQRQLVKVLDQYDQLIEALKVKDLKLIAMRQKILEELLKGGS